MTFSSSYLQLDGVEFKISDAVNPPELPTLPHNFKIKDISKLLEESVFDFSMETEVLAKISVTRESERKMAEQEERRKQLSMRRKAENEKRNQEEMAELKKVLQKKKEEFSEQKRKKQQEKEGSSPESTSPTADLRESSTYENFRVLPATAANPFSLAQDSILTPQPAVRNVPDGSSGASGQNQIWEDFEEKELDPFTNAELKTIDDMAELKTVLQNAEIGRGLKESSDISQPKNSQNIGGILYENVSLAEIKEIASKLESQKTETTPKSSHTSSGPSDRPETTEPLYSKVQKKRPEKFCTNFDHSDSVATGFNSSNPFLGQYDNHEVTNNHVISQSSILANMVDPLSGGFDPNARPTVPKSQTQTQAPSKILPVSFGTPNGVINVPNPQITPKSSGNPHQTGVSQTQNIRPVRKPPVPAPRKPAIPPRRPVQGVTPVTVAPAHNGQSHLSPPYSLPQKEETQAPSVGSGFIHKSKQDRAKFTETVNKALGSLPQNPKPVKKEKNSTTNSEPKPSPPMSRSLSLVVDHLIKVQQLTEQGYKVAVVQDALDFYPDDAKSVIKYVQQTSQLTDMGFPEDDVREALKRHDNDQAKALDQLMAAT